MSKKSPKDKSFTLRLSESELLKLKYLSYKNNMPISQIFCELIAIADIFFQPVLPDKGKEKENEKVNEE